MTSFLEERASSSFSSTLTASTSDSSANLTRTTTATALRQLSQSSRNILSKATPSTVSHHRSPKRYRVSGQTRRGLLNNLQNKPCGDVVIFRGPPDFGCIIIGVGRGYGDATEDRAFVERGLERVVHIIGRGLSLNRHLEVEDLELLVENAWVEGSCWVSEDISGWRKGFGGCIGVLWRDYWVFGGIGDGGGVRLSKRERKGQWTSHSVGESHSVWNMTERDRIQHFGGSVEGSRVTDGVGGSLPVTRCCGCMRFRSCGVLALPWVQGGKLSKQDRGILVSTTPIIGKGRSDEGADLMKAESRKHESEINICERLLDTAEKGIPRMEDMAIAYTEIIW